jgi:predicted DNA-binding antitoxin AbrB/MazE fold protein
MYYLYIRNGTINVRESSMVKAIYRDNSFHLIDPVNLEEGDEVEIRILPVSEIKKLKGAFCVGETRTIEEIIESDLFE